MEYKKSSAVLVFNDSGELALQLRAAGDSSYPSHWDFSAGGGIDPGENSKLAAEREMQEELGDETDIKFITEEHFTYPGWTNPTSREVDLSIYKTHHNGPFNPNLKEVEMVQFFQLSKIDEMIKSGQKFHPEFAQAWDRGAILKAAKN